MKVATLQLMVTMTQDDPKDHVSGLEELVMTQ